MELISNAPASQDLQLTPDQEKELVSFIATQWEEGRKARSPYAEKWDVAKLAYKTQLKDEDKRRKSFQSVVSLPWTYTATEAWKAFLLSQIWSYDIERFTLTPVSDDDTKGCDVMQTFLNLKMEEADIFFTLTQALHDLSFGYCVVKINWLKDDTTNNVQYTNVDPEDFMFYPIVGDFNKSTRIQRLWMFYEDLIATDEQLGTASPYKNLEALEPKDNDIQNQTSEFWSSGECHKHRQGIEIKEAWIHHVRLRADGGKTLKNIVATVAKGKHLIRIEANSYPKGEAPFVTTCLVQDGHYNLGWGLTTMAQRVQSTANDLLGMRLDNVKKTQNAMFKFVDDKVFDPMKFISRPGGLVKVADINNLQPLDANAQLFQNLFQEIESLKNEFEEATMPRSIRGQLDNIQRTATESNNLQSNASSIISQHAKRINEKVLKPLVQWTYLLTLKRLEEDPDLKLNMARITQNRQTQAKDVDGNPILNPETQTPLMVTKDDLSLVKELPSLLPLQEVDVRIVGYENQSQRDKKAGAFMNFMPLFLQSPGAKYANIDNMAEESLLAVGLDPKTLLVDDEKRRQADQMEAETSQAQQDAQNQLAMANIQIQQQALEIQRLQVTSSTQVNAQKAQNDFAIKLLQLELEELKAGVDVDLAPQQNVLQGMMNNANIPNPTA